MRRVLVGSILVTLLLLALPSAAAQPQGPTSPGDVVSAWASAWNARQLDAVLALYTDEAVFLPPTGQRITGLPAIRELIRHTLGTENSRIRMQAVTLTREGSVAVESGSYTEQIEGGGKGRTVQGNYLFTLVQTPGGSWRIAQQMWTEVGR